MAVGGIDGSMSGPTTANTHVPRSTVRTTSNVIPGWPVASQYPA